MNVRGSARRTEDRRKIDALIDKLYSMAMRGNVAAAGLFLDRVLGPVSGGRPQADSQPDLRQVSYPRADPPYPASVITQNRP